MSGPAAATALSFAAVAALTLALLAGPTAAAAEDDACGRVGAWLDPRTGRTLAVDRLLGEMAERPVVLLGENHDDAEHHRWQLHTLAALHGRKPAVIVGFEMFPRRVQAALDRWTDGQLDEAAFLKAADWAEVWGFEQELYLPLFHFARQNRLAMVGLNVERALVSRVGRDGWAAVPPAEREGLGDPAPASQAYREWLAEVFAEKLRRFGESEAEEAAEPPDVAAILEREDFGRFVEAQLTWDRAMAEALAAARRASPDALVIGIIGQGHLRHGYGVPHQLRDLGIADPAVLLPVDAEAACEALPRDLADAVFVVDAAAQVEAARPKPRLGVMVETAEDGVRITRVLDGSVAAAAGLAAGDIVAAAAGRALAGTAELIEVIGRQAPGTWLPLRIRRGGEDLDFVAKFPSDLGTAE